MSKIPEELLPNDYQGGRFLTIGDSLYYDYRSIYQDFRSELTLEYLSDKELKDNLWYLFCEIYLNTDKYKSDENINKKIDVYISTICKPINEYEIFIGIENLDEKRGLINIWDFSIFQLSNDDFYNKFGKSKRLELDKDKFVNRGLMSFIEKGNNLKLVCDRAREKAKFNIKILQLYLRNSHTLWDDQILFSISEYILIRNIKNSKDIYSTFHRNRKPEKLGSIKAFEELFDLAEDHYTKLRDLEPKLANHIKRTIHWIGEAINEEDYDLKIIALCTAIETLLTTRDERKKGEKIAYRILLLNKELSTPFTNPFKILFIYNLRSKVIHGSGLSICGESDYFTMLYEVKRILNNCINYVHNNNITKISTMIKNLESKDNIEWLNSWVKSWLGRYNDKIVGDILDAVKINK